MRETKYAREVREPGVIIWPDGNEARIERLFVKERREEEIRFSWWKGGKMLVRPLDLTEGDLMTLFEDAIAKNVFTDEFIAGLRRLL